MFVSVFQFRWVENVCLLWTEPSDGRISNYGKVLLEKLQHTTETIKAQNIPLNGRLVKTMKTYLLGTNVIPVDILSCVRVCVYVCVCISALFSLNKIHINIRTHAHCTHTHTDNGHSCRLCLSLHSIWFIKLTPYNYYMREKTLHTEIPPLYWLLLSSTHNVQRPTYLCVFPSMKSSIGFSSFATAVITRSRKKTRSQRRQNDNNTKKQREPSTKIKTSVTFVYRAFFCRKDIK